MILRRKLALVLLFAGCADAHLGELYGRRTRSALDSSRDAKSEGAVIDSDDAKLVSTRHHNRVIQGQSGGQGGGGGGSMGSFQALGGASAAPAGGSSIGRESGGGGGGGGIRLDAIK